MIGAYLDKNKYNVINDYLELKKKIYFTNAKKKF